MKILRIIGLFCFLISCENNSEKNQSIDQTDLTTLITKADISNLNYSEFILDNNAEKKISDWNKYFELDTHVLNIKQNDLSFFKANNENILAFINDLRASVPELIISSSIMARLTALETKIYILESTVNLANASKKDILYSIQDFLISFSNLNFQINKKFEKEAQNIQKPQ